MPTSSNVANYFVGKGIAKWTPEGGQERELGNAPSVKISPEFETLDHFSSQAGVKSKDLSVSISKQLTLTVTLDEITPDNLALFLFGTITTNTAGNEEFQIYSESTAKGQFVLEGTNDVGNKFTMTLPSVSIKPTGEFDFISDEFGTMEIQGDVLLVGDSFGTIEQTDAAATA